jgi:muramoyltetrapeptide carboxypeptidase LdcA involved in peptidoglycan recycling
VADLARHGVTVSGVGTVSDRCANDDHAKLRAHELTQALNQSTASLAMATIGGFTAMDLLPELDFGRLAESQIPLCGYSDITVLQLAGMTHGMPSLVGPMLMTHFGDQLGCDEFTWNHFTQALRFHAGELDELPFPDPGYRLSTHEPWGGPTEGIRFRLSCGPPHTLQPGRARGPLIVGNVAALDMLIGTPFQPPLNGAILGIEASETQTFYEVRRLLHKLRLTGVLDRLSALLLGRVTEEGQMTGTEVDRAVAALIPAGLPLVTGLPFGHVDPIVTIPLGCMADLYAGDTVTMTARRRLTP